MLIYNVSDPIKVYLRHVCYFPIKEMKLTTSGFGT